MDHESSPRPLIGIPARFSVHASALRHAAEVSSRSLIELVFAAGGEPVMLHPHAPDAEINVPAIADRLGWLDAFLLPGGGDLSGRWSNQGDHPSLYDVDEEQDAFDLSVAQYALDNGVPLMSVCRGTQVVNVLLGGTLVQDMDSHSEALNHHRHHVHRIETDPGSRLGDVLGPVVEVSCYHHQCVYTLGKGLVVTARAEEGVIEGVELPDAPGYYVGVQWHPEDTWDGDPLQLELMKSFVSAARAARSKTAENV